MLNLIISLLPGLVSVVSLLVSLSLPQWVITVESSSSPSSPPHPSPPLHLHIGLFSVCPELRLEANLSLTEVAVVKCRSLSDSEEQQEEEAPFSSRTARVLSRIRSDRDNTEIIDSFRYWGGGPTISLNDKLHQEDQMLLAQLFCSNTETETGAWLSPPRQPGASLSD